MPNEWKTTWRASGSGMSNAQTRTFTPTAPALLENYRRITSITRRNGLYCKTGGTSQNVVVYGYDELLISGEVILRSAAGSCRIYGSGPSSSDYMTTSFTEISAQESRRILDAWKAGTLQIRRTVWVYSATSGSHGAPYFRSGYYNDDITIAGTDSAYMPTVELSAFSAADEARLYAEAWANPPFDFTLKTSIADSDYWEDPTKLYRRIEISATNLTGESPAMEPIILESEALATEWAITQDSALFIRETDGFLRGSRYRIAFTFAVGTSADAITESAVVFAEVDVAAIPFHMSRAGNGVAIGKYSAAGSNIDEKLFECAYSARFYEGIEGVTDYRMDEVETGGRWIDGSRIYRCVIEINASTLNSTVEIAEIPDMAAMVNLHGYITRTAGTQRFPPVFWVSETNYHSVWVDGGKLCARTSHAIAGYVIIEYTKNTEEGN